MFLNVVICFFTVLGIIRVIEEVIKYFRSCEENYVVVIQVKNQQDKIEGIIRSVVWRELKTGTVPEILVVDMGSTDDTLKILENISREYDFIVVSNKEKYFEYLEKKGRENEL